MAKPQIATCPQCLRTIAPDDTVVIRSGVLGHLDCRRPRVLKAEELTLLFIYCGDHPVAECVRCTKKLFLRDAVSLDPVFDIRAFGCPGCQTDLTQSIRGHLYACALLPAAVQRRAQEAHDAARHLVKQSQQLRHDRDVLIREAEAMRTRAREATPENKDPEK